MKIVLSVIMIFILTGCKIKKDISLYEPCEIGISAYNDDLIIHTSNTNNNDLISIGNDNYAQIRINKNDKRYNDYYLKYMFIREISDNNNSFIKFHKWYRKNKDKKFYVWRKFNIVQYEIPEYITKKYRTIPTMIGKIPFIRTTSYEQINPAYIETKIIYYDYFENPKNDDYKKMECNIFYFYKNMMMKGEFVND